LQPSLALQRQTLPGDGISASRLPLEDKNGAFQFRRNYQRA
jgi:hypothetical protein